MTEKFSEFKLTYHKLPSLASITTIGWKRTQVDESKIDFNPFNNSTFIKMLLNLHNSQFIVCPSREILGSFNAKGFESLQHTAVTGLWQSILFTASNPSTSCYFCFIFFHKFYKIYQSFYFYSFPQEISVVSYCRESSE